MENAQSIKNQRVTKNDFGVIEPTPNVLDLLPASWRLDQRKRLPGHATKDITLMQFESVLSGLGREDLHVPFKVYVHAGGFRGMLKEPNVIIKDSNSGFILHNYGEHGYLSIETKDIKNVYLSYYKETGSFDMIINF